MSTDDQPAKRPREDGLEPELSITRSPDYWFEDGSIVLQVESTQFRVAKTMLAMHSSVFKDMLSLPPTDESLVEGCPVVVLSGDSSTDWTHLLGAMYTKGGFTDPKDTPTLGQLSAILRLSKKYDIPELRRRCVACLKKEFPATIADYDAKNKKMKIFSFIKLSELNVQFLAKIIELAREVGLYSILPLALYIINALNVPAGIHSPLFTDIDAADQLRILRGRTQLYALFPLRSPLKWMDSQHGSVPSQACTQRRECQAVVAAINDAVLRKNDYLVCIFLEWPETRTEKLCENCTVIAKEVHRSMREQCWNELPSYFDLPPWEELLKMDLE
ncbi:BTB domain-containing protein [Mycena kentingensis (nom. inval.)]|nr:BTB domain-containing protein [Mycena kentingensis (nom. inval.)]